MYSIHFCIFNHGMEKCGIKSSHSDCTGLIINGLLTFYIHYTSNFKRTYYAKKKSAFHLYTVLAAT